MATSIPSAWTDLLQQFFPCSPRPRGLLARFLWSRPKSPVGQRAMVVCPLPEVVARLLAQNDGRPLDTEPQPNGKVYLLTLDAGAAVAVRVFRDDLEPQLIGDLAPILDWAGKLPGLVCRVAAVLHAFEHSRDFVHRPTGAATMEAAIRIGRHATAHALQVLTAMGLDGDTVLARRGLP